MSSEAVEHLRRSAELAWDTRWTFVKDANGDGAVTTADVSYWAEYIFFAPGDWLILGIMKQQPDVAAFFGMTLDLQSGLVSGILSLAVWFAIGAFLASLSR